MGENSGPDEKVARRETRKEGMPGIYCNKIAPFFGTPKRGNCSWQLLSWKRLATATLSVCLIGCANATGNCHIWKSRITFSHHTSLNSHQRWKTKQIPAILSFRASLLRTTLSSSVRSTVPARAAGVFDFTKVSPNIPLNLSLLQLRKNL